MNDPKVDLSRGYDRPDNWEIRLYPLPALIVCPRCDRLQLVTDEVLPPEDRIVLSIRPTEDPGIRSGEQTAGEPTKTAE